MRWGALLRLLDGRWLWGSPLLLATLCSFGFGLAAILDVAGALRRAEGVRAEVATELARLATEAAAIQCFATHESQVHLAVGEFDVHGVPDGELLLLSTVDRDHLVGLAAPRPRGRGDPRRPAPHPAGNLEPQTAAALG